MIKENLIYGDMKCIKYLYKINGHKVYEVKCTKCGRYKEMKDYVIKQHIGVYHSACGKGIKTKNLHFYKKWQSMRTRTTNTKYHRTDRYIDRGIDSDEFKLFIDFYDTMFKSYKLHVELYGEKNTTLERINNNKSYSVDNCRWATVHEQRNNTRKNKIFLATDPNGNMYMDKGVTQFCNEFELDKSSVSDVLNNRSSNHKAWTFKYLN